MLTNAGGFDFVPDPRNDSLEAWAVGAEVSLQRDEYELSLDIMSMREADFVLKTFPSLAKTRPRTLWLGGSGSISVGDHGVLRTEVALSPRRSFTLDPAETALLARTGVRRTERTSGGTFSFCSDTNSSSRTGRPTFSSSDADVLATFATLEDLAAEVEETSGGRYRIAVTGPPIVTGTLNVYLNQDALTLNPVSAALTSRLLFVCLRSLAGVFLPLTVMLPSIGAGFAAMTWLGYTFTPFSNAVPVVILAASIADSVHIISAYYDRRIADPGRDQRACLLQVLGDLRTPIALTSVTTACGFLLLGHASPMLPVQQFGVTVAVGVMAAMVYSLTVLPCVMLLLGVEPSESFRRAFAAGTQGRTSMWSRFVDGFVRVAVNLEGLGDRLRGHGLRGHRREPAASARGLRAGEVLPAGVTRQPGLLRDGGELCGR